MQRGQAPLSIVLHKTRSLFVFKAGTQVQIIQLSSQPVTLTPAAWENQEEISSWLVCGMWTHISSQAQYWGRETQGP